MFLNIIHDFSLLIAYIECSCRSIPRGGQIGVDIIFIRSVDVAGSLIKNDFSFSAHELQHQN